MSEPNGIINTLMIVGFAIWVIGEGWGIYRNFSQHKDLGDTTSEWVWHIQLRYPILRLVIGLFLITLFTHLEFGTILLP